MRTASSAPGTVDAPAPAPSGARCTHGGHAGDAASALACAEARCRARGARFEGTRRDVLTALHIAGVPLGAYDLAERLARPDRRLAPISVYRALDFLTAQGLVHRLATRNAFLACPHGHEPSDAVAFLICEGCGTVEEAMSEPLAASLTALAGAQGFRPSAQVIEMSGLCSGCGERARP